MQYRILLLVSVQPNPSMRSKIAAGIEPPRDYDALQSVLDADAIYPEDALKTRFGRLLKRIFGVRIALVWAGFCRRHKYDVIYSDTEIVGLPLAMLLTLSGTRTGRPRHVTLSHYLTPYKKRIFFRLGASSHIDTIIVHCEAQRVLATKILHMPRERVVKLPYFVEEHFWHPVASGLIDRDCITNVGNDGRPMICAAGLEFRDYPTLMTAVKDLDVNLHIAAGSAPAFYLAATGSRRTTSAGLPDLLPNVSVGRYDYAGMRQLYSAARFVVIPLCQKDAPAGVTVILEAMPMGKAVIATGTKGQTDVLRDPRNNGRGLVEREWWPGFLDVPGVSETLGSLPTGFYVSPGDVDELRNSIQYLLDHPEVADEMGRNGQRVAKEYFNLDAFAQRFAAAIRGEPHPELVYNPQFQQNAITGGI